MIKQTLAEFAKLCGGRLVNADSGQSAQFVRSACEVDSRLITPGGVFFALGDGLQYVSDAFKNGAAVCVVDKQPELECEAGPLILVDNTLQALARAASGLLAAVRRHREKEGLVFNVIGITGSCGKTTTKNILGYILSNISTTVVPRRSFNNEIGVPLTILQIDYNTQNLVLEMGASAVGDIAKLVQIAQPNIACVLNVGTSHIEGFGGIENTSKTKAELVVGVCEFARANRADGNASAQATAGFEAGRLGDIGEMTPGTEEPRKEAGIGLGVNSTRTTAGIVLGVDDLRVARMIELVPEGFSGSVCTFSMCAGENGQGELRNYAFLAQTPPNLHMYAKDIKNLQNGVEFTFYFTKQDSSTACSGNPPEEGSIRIRTQIPGEHSVYNYLAAIATAYCAGVSVERAATLAAQCTHFEPYRMQLTVLSAAYEPKVPSQQNSPLAQNPQNSQTAQNSPNSHTSPPAQNPQTPPPAQNLPLAQPSSEATAGDKMRDRAPLLHILNDAYNANQESCISALRTLAGLDTEGKRFAVFGAIAEQGSEVLKAYDSIAQVVVRLNIDHCVVVGKEARALYFAVVSQGSWDQEAVFCKDLDEAFNFLKSSVLPGDCVLFKASNIFKLWELGDRFTQYMQQRLIRPEHLEQTAQNLQNSQTAQNSHPAPSQQTSQTTQNSPSTHPAHSAQNSQTSQIAPNPPLAQNSPSTHPAHSAPTSPSQPTSPHQRGTEK